MEQYLKEISRVKNQDDLIQKNLRFVIKLAKEMCYPGSDLMELIQAGNLGLMEAAQKYDSKLGVKFITFAKYYVRWEMYKSLQIWKPRIFKYIPEVSELVTPESEIIWKELNEKFEKQLKEFSKKLPERDGQLFHTRLIADEPVSLASLGREWGVSRERMRQREVQLVSQLKKTWEEENGIQTIE